MERCRPPGRRVQVRVQAHVQPTWAAGARIAMAGPDPNGPSPDPEVARCCGLTLAAAAPSAGWDPGQSGLFSFDVAFE
jgi:hypothetical protein